jgi:hypothetical protein
MVRSGSSNISNQMENFTPKPQKPNVSQTPNFKVRRRIIALTVFFGGVLVIWIIVQLCIGIVSTILGLASAGESNSSIGLPDPYAGKQCSPADVRIELALTQTTFPLKEGAKFHVKTTMLGKESCMISTTDDARKLLISQDGNPIFTVLDQCVFGDTGLILQPGDIIDQEVPWSGKRTSTFMTIPMKDDDGNPEVDPETGQPLIGENGKPMIQQWCEPGEKVDKGHFVAQFNYPNLPGVTSNPVEFNLE